MDGEHGHDGTRLTSTLAALLVAQAPDAVIFADPEGTIRVWNDAATAIFGYPTVEAVGQNLDIIVPEPFREAHWAGFARALEDGVTKYQGQSLPTRAVNAAGEKIYVELSFAIIVEAGGGVAGAVAHARDITERFEQERETRKRLRELEGQVAQESDPGSPPTDR